MFTIQQIKEAHSKVKSGADFPQYIQDIKKLGVKAFQTWVKDSHTDYFDKENNKISSESMYSKLEIADTCNPAQFKEYLKIHQQGETNYLTFCKHCAETGILNWFVDLDKMTCTYFSKSKENVLVEIIPEK